MFVPVDVVKERLQVQRTSGVAVSSALNGGVGGGGGGGVREAPVRPYRGSADTLKTILRIEGLRGIYKVRPGWGGVGESANCFGGSSWCGPEKGVYFQLLSFHPSQTRHAIPTSSRIHTAEA